jgi:hypothetical protein
MENNLEKEQLWHDHLPGGTEENHKKKTSVRTTDVAAQIQTASFRIQVQNATTKSTCSL